MEDNPFKSPEEPEEAAADYATLQEVDAWTFWFRFYVYTHLLLIVAFAVAARSDRVGHPFAAALNPLALLSMLYFVAGILVAATALLFWNRKWLSPLPLVLCLLNIYVVLPTIQ